MKEVERLLWVRLFDRTTRQLDTTAAGRALLLMTGAVLDDRDMRLHRRPPPRARGRLDARAGRRVGRRTTPAHARKTIAFASSRVSRWDHPRSREEDTS
ncbi:hypothetical protein [Kutzneria albida]|uniref:hypothetical protein n=1 Tax=Kutzneria TaxID=43356 RepID=UPI003B837A9F